MYVIILMAFVIPFIIKLKKVSDKQGPDLRQARLSTKCVGEQAGDDNIGQL
jgi:hypothetical protein